MLVAATREDTLKAGLGSQDWDARAAKEVAAARARGAQLPALVDRKQHRAEFLRMKAERAETSASSKPHDSELVEVAAAAKAEVPAQHLPALPSIAPVFSCTYSKKGNTRRVCCQDVTAARDSRLAAPAGVRGNYQITVPFQLRIVVHGR